MEGEEVTRCNFSAGRILASGRTTRMADECCTNLVGVRSLTIDDEFELDEDLDGDIGDKSTQGSSSRSVMSKSIYVNPTRASQSTSRARWPTPPLSPSASMAASSMSLLIASISTTCSEWISELSLCPSLLSSREIRSIFASTPNMLARWAGTELLESRRSSDNVYPAGVSSDWGEGA